MFDINWYIFKGENVQKNYKSILKKRPLIHAVDISFLKRKTNLIIRLATNITQAINKTSLVINKAYHIDSYFTKKKVYLHGKRSILP